MRFPGFPEDVFIYQGAEATYYRKRDKEIARNVLLAGIGALGLAGSDALNESPVLGASSETLLPIVNDRGQPLRFVLATCATRQAVRRVESKIANNEPLRVATSYPNTAIRDLQEKLGIDSFIPAVGRQTGGIEAVAWQFPDEVDAVFELVQTGDSVRDNGLQIIEDDITSVDLCKVTTYNTANNKL